MFLGSGMIGSCRFPVHKGIASIGGEHAEIVVADRHILYSLSVGLVRCMNIYGVDRIVQNSGCQLLQKQVFLCLSNKPINIVIWFVGAKGDY